MEQEDDSIPGSITNLYQEWRSGKSDALGELIARFRPRLLALARSTLNPRFARMADAEDVLQSAMLSFWKRSEECDLAENLDRNDLWNILGQMTARKAIKVIEKERALKRGGGKVVVGTPFDEGLNQMVHGEVELELVCAELIELLDPQLRSFALMRLLGHTNGEIAAHFDCSERKVERKLNLVRAVWAEEIKKW